MRPLATLLLSLTLQAQSLPTGDRFLAHLNNELLPFWLNPAAFGTPQGTYPTTRCNDGTAVNFQRPCIEVGRNGWLMQQQHFLVAQSRQAYAYGVAFHLTGEARYLELMKSGVDFIRNSMIDRRNGGLFVSRSLPNGQWGPTLNERNAQALAYGLLGMSFYYYLTRDSSTLDDIMYVRDHILGKYYNPNTNSMRWDLTTSGNIKNLTAQLDQLNAYMVL
ncbi:MAG: AGE family epimerase/isomerase, partial [Acidobacteria bacterium]|nr:AGE family epimerase/isomerase [Acidobacteriota bacterium]